MSIGEADVGVHLLIGRKNDPVVTTQASKAKGVSHCNGQLIYNIQPAQLLTVF